MVRSHRIKGAFTILELLVVISIIVALCGISYPIYTRIQSNAAISGTKTLVQAVVTAATEYGHDFITGTDGKSWHAWMLGQVATDDVTQVTTQMDGDPILYPSTDPSPLAQRAPLSYRGFINMTGIQVPWKPNAKGQIIDRWQNPLNIAYNPQVYGKDGIGVWSNGPDKVSQGGAVGSDDITSWAGSGSQ